MRKWFSRHSKGLGFIDIISDRKVVGWATGGDAQPVVVELLVDRLVFSETLACMYRGDLARAGYGDGRHGWEIDIPADISARPDALSARIKASGYVLGKRNTIRATSLPGDNSSALAAPGFGFFDEVVCGKAVGWASDGTSEPVWVELLVDGAVVGEALANEYRKGIESIGFGDGRRGWSIDVPAGSPRGGVISARIKKSGYVLPDSAGRASSGIGFIDRITDRKAIGWAADGGWEPVVVELLVHGTVVGETLADEFREDLAHIGYGGGRRGWTIDIPANLWTGAAAYSARIKSTGVVLPNNVVRDADRLSQNFINSTFLGKPEVETGFTARDPDAFDVEIAREIIDLAKKIPAYRIEEGTIWDRHTRTSQLGFLELLRAGDAVALAEFLVSLATKRETTGFLQGEEAYRDLAAAHPEGRVMVEGPAKDALVSLAQYLAVERLETVEVGPYGEAILKDQKALAARIEGALGVPLTPPAVFSGLHGLRIAGGIVDRRAIQAVYAAHRLLSAAGKTDAAFCEIGGGIGMAAYYATILGARRYDIVDLPNMALFQYYYLRRALPDRKVSVVTTPRDTWADINLIPASIFHDLDRSWRWDACLNCDSFPEMGDAVCLGYLAQIKLRTQLLLSINQEAGCPLTPNVHGPHQTVVSELIRDDPDYRKLYRIRSWVRHGFAEELYAIARSQGRAGQVAPWTGNEPASQLRG